MQYDACWLSGGTLKRRENEAERKTYPKAKKPRRKLPRVSDGHGKVNGATLSSDGESDRSSCSQDAVPQDRNRNGLLRSGTKRKINQSPKRGEDQAPRHSPGHTGKQRSTRKDEKAEREDEKAEREDEKAEREDEKAEREDEKAESDNDNTSVLLCEDDNEFTQLINKPSLVDKEYPQSYSQQVDIKDPPDGHQLQRTPFDHKIQDIVKAVLAEDAAGKPNSAWTSEYLPLALNLKTSNPLKDILQSLVLAQNKPPVILVLCEDGENIRESALAYASEMARALTTSLLKYCHCEFILLACAVSKDTFSTETLREKIEEKRKQTSKMYYRRQHLSRSEYLQLKKAVTRVSRVSPVCHHLADSSDIRQLPTQENKINNETRSQELVILDEDWYNLVLYFINKVMQGTNRFKVRPPRADGVALKVKVAAKEAGRRLGVKATCTEGQGYLEINIEDTAGQQ